MLLRIPSAFKNYNDNILLLKRNGVWLHDRTKNRFERSFVRKIIGALMTFSLAVRINAKEY